MEEDHDLLRPRHAAGDPFTYNRPARRIIMSIIASKSCLSIRLLAVWLILLSTPTFAQLVCNGTPEGFDTGIPSGWTVTGTSGAVWGDLTACGESENFTGGSGDAGCASSDAFGPGSFSTELKSPLFDLAGVSQASLRMVSGREWLVSRARSDRVRVWCEALRVRGGESARDHRSAGIVRRGAALGGSYGAGGAALSGPNCQPDCGTPNGG